MVKPDTLQSKLIDFGFAEKINKEKLVSKSGTPGYVCPELFDQKPFTEKGDIYALGIVLFAVVSGYSPFTGKTL